MLAITFACIIQDGTTLDAGPLPLDAPALDAVRSGLECSREKDRGSFRH